MAYILFFQVKKIFVEIIKYKKSYLNSVLANTKKQNYRHEEESLKNLDMKKIISHLKSWDPAGS